MTDAERIAQLEAELHRLKGMVAHEFNNSLCVIIAGVEELRLPRYDQDRDDVLNDMKHAADHMRLQVIALSGYGGTNGR